MYLCMHVCVYVCVCVCIYVGKYVCRFMYVYLYLCIYECRSVCKYFPKWRWYLLVINQCLYLTKAENTQNQLNQPSKRSSVFWGQVSSVLGSTWVTWKNCGLNWTIPYWFKCICRYVYLCMHVCMYVCICVCIYVCKYLCRFMYLCL